MHIPDGYLGPETYGGFWAIMTPIWLYASKKVKQTLDAARVPYLAMASAFSLSIMLFTLPLPGGTTGHVTGSTLVAILLGPWAAILALSVALIIQALVFGDGGVTAIGANCFNVALVGATVGYGVYRIITWFFLKPGPSSLEPGKTDRSPSLLPRLVGAGIASYVATNVGGLFAALELGLQPLLYPTGSATSSYFPYPLKVALPAVMIPHLTAIGLLEVAVTVFVLLLLSKSQHDISPLSRKAALTSMAFLFLLLPSSAVAHEFWIEKKGQEFMLVFGHGSQRLEFDASKVKTLKAFDAQGREIPVTKEKKATGFLLRAEGSPSLFFVEIDDGYWSKTIYGWKNLPKRRASRVIESIRSYYTSKAILSSGEICQRPFAEVKLDLIPVENPMDLKAGEVLPIRVLYQGNPLPGIEIEGRDHQKIAWTDNDGMARPRLSKGHQVFSVKYREPIKNDPDADFLSITSTLTFEVTK